MAKPFNWGFLIGAKWLNSHLLKKEKDKNVVNFMSSLKIISEISLTSKESKQSWATLNNFQQEPAKMSWYAGKLSIQK